MYSDVIVEFGIVTIELLYDLILTDLNVISITVPWCAPISTQSPILNGLSVKTLWALRKNMKKIAEVADYFKEFKEGLEQEIKDDFFNSEKSEETVVKDNEGNETPAQKVKDEYLQDYQTRINEINGKLNELVLTKEEFDFTPIDIESEVERLDTDCNLNMDDLDILSVFE